MSSVSKDWNNQTSIIIHQYDLNNVSLDEIYEMLKTHDLEVQERRNKRNLKAKSTIVKAQIRSSKPSGLKTSSKKLTREASYIDESSDIDGNTNEGTNTYSEDAQFNDMFAMLVKGFKRMKFR